MVRKLIHFLFQSVNKRNVFNIFKSDIVNTIFRRSGVEVKVELNKDL